MAFRVLKTFAVSTLLIGSVALAQSGNTGNNGGGTGNSGNSGVSGGIGSDFAGANVAGANVGKGGGLASAIEEAFNGEGKKPECNPATGSC